MEFLNEIINEAYERFFLDPANGCEFFREFYDRLFNKSSEIKAKFSEVDMEKQYEILNKGMLFIIDNYSCDEPNEYINNLITLHDSNHLNVTPAMFDIWQDTFIETLRHFDKNFSGDKELRWNLVLGKTLSQLKKGNNP